MPKITGKQGVNNRLNGMIGKGKVALVGQALFAGGEELRAEAQVSITTGAVSGKGHVRSNPGEPPNNDTGLLAAFINVTQTTPLRVTVASEAQYAAALEYGTSKMAARPYMGPAVRKTRKAIVARVEKAINHVTKKKS